MATQALGAPRQQKAGGPPPPGISTGIRVMATAARFSAALPAGAAIRLNAAQRPATCRRKASVNGQDICPLSIGGDANWEGPWAGCGGLASERAAAAPRPGADRARAFGDRSCPPRTPHDRRDSL